VSARGLQVSLAALSLLQTVINTCAHVLESSLDKLMPLLFLKLCGAKQAVRGAAEASLQGDSEGEVPGWRTGVLAGSVFTRVALACCQVWCVCSHRTPVLPRPPSARECPCAGCALHMDPDLLLPALTRSLEAMKQPAARVSVMEFVVLFMGVGRIAGVPANGTYMRCALRGAVPAASDALG
jgi:hypothetical protein